MVDTYGRWTYEPNTPEEKKCDCDRVADWIISTGYKNELSIESLTEMVISYAEEFYKDEFENNEWNFDLEYIKQYVEDSGGLLEFDYEGQVNIMLNKIKEQEDCKIFDITNRNTKDNFDFDFNSLLPKEERLSDWELAELKYHALRRKGV